MIALVEGASRQKTPNEIALNILLASLTIVFLMATVTLQPFAIYSGAEQSLIVLVALLVCLIPTTIGALLSAIGIAGMDRLVQHNVLAMSGRAVEAAGDVNTLLLDKTGTITLGNRQAAEFLAGRRRRRRRAGGRRAAVQPGRRDARGPLHRGARQDRARPAGARARASSSTAHFVPFTAQTRMSGVDLDGGRQIRKGAAAAVMKWVRDNGGHPTDEVGAIVDAISTAGGTPLVVAERVDGQRGPHAGRDPPQGRRQGGHARAVRRDAPDGHPHRDDHRRQPADRPGHRRGGRGRRLPRRGHARGQDGADQARSRRAAGWSR